MITAKEVEKIKTLRTAGKALRGAIHCNLANLDADEAAAMCVLTTIIVADSEDILKVNGISFSDDTVTMSRELLRNTLGDPITGAEYQIQAMRTASIPENKKQERLYHAVLGLNSEAGEVAGILQKKYQGHDVDKDHLLKELGDCLWMIAEACDALDADMSEVMKMNINKLKERYPNGFEADKSLHRKEGDV